MVGDTAARADADRRFWRPPRKMEVLECKVSKNINFRLFLEDFFEGVFRGGGTNALARVLIELALFSLLHEIE